MPLRSRPNALLLIAAAIWGFAFVAQRMGMEHVGPFTFNAIRFALGSLVLLPWVFRHSKKASVSEELKGLRLLGAGCLAGLFLFAGSSLQQIGIVYTTAGKAGFITGLYVVMVPILGLFWGQRTNKETWGGALLAVLGLYLLSMRGDFTLEKGDTLVLLGALCWAGHVHIVGRFSPRSNPWRLACLQFFVVSLLSWAFVFFYEELHWSSIRLASVAILYAGVMSVGVAFTLQVVAQKKAKATHAAIILSLEALFAAWGGWMILGEVLPGVGILGCALMLFGMILSQLRFRPRG